MKKPAIAASSYLNTAPLCYSFLSGTQQSRAIFLSDEAPAKCSELLVQKEVDAALIPAIEYPRTADLKVVPGVCVASKHRVKSVVLVSRKPLEEVRSVALDTHSRTSVALVKIILGSFLRVEASYEPAPPDLEAMLSGHDAALIIGDPAMTIDRSAVRVYDLAEEWRRHTGLPFVFAFWAIRPESVGMIRESGIDFEAAKEEGLAHAELIAEQYSASLRLEKRELLAYLTRNINYDLDAESLRGLNEYYRLAFQNGLIGPVRELEFI